MSFLFVFGTVGAYLLCRARGFDRWMWGGLFLFAGVVLLANWFWISPFLQHAHLKTKSGYHWIGDRYAVAGELFRFREFGLRLLLYCLGGAGLLVWWREGRKELVALFLALGGVLTFFGYVAGELAFFRDMETYRNNLVVSFLLIAPASAFVTTTLEGLRAAPHRRRLAFLALVLPLGLLTCHTGSQQLLRYLRGNVLRPFGPDEMAVIQSLRDDPGPEGRVAVERWPLGCLVPWYTGKQVVGGPYPLVWLPHNFVNFAYLGLGHGDLSPGARLFGRQLSSLSADDFQSYLAAYNVSQIVAWSDESKAFLARQEGLEPTGTHGPYVLYRRRLPSTFFVKGSGQVEAEYGRLRVTKASRGEIILKYHWSHSLVTEPAQELLPHTVLDDPVPFIRLPDNRFSQFIIRDGPGQRAGARSSSSSNQVPNQVSRR
jgi:hypothetical protein